MSAAAPMGATGGRGDASASSVARIDANLNIHVRTGMRALHGMVAEPVSGSGRATVPHAALAANLTFGHLGSNRGRGLEPDVHVPNCQETNWVHRLRLGRCSTTSISVIALSWLFLLMMPFFTSSSFAW